MSYVMQISMTTYIPNITGAPPRPRNMFNDTAKCTQTSIPDFFREWGGPTQATKKKILEKIQDFSRLYFQNCLSCVPNYEDHSHLYIFFHT